MYNDYLSAVTCLHFRLMLWLLDDEGNVFFNMLEHYHSSTMRWQHSWLGSGLNDGSAEAGPLFGLRSLLTHPSYLLPIWLYERWGLHVAHSSILNKFKDQIWKAVPNIEHSLFREVTIIWNCSEYKMDHILILYRIWK